MIKEIALVVPRYVKKFLWSEPDYKALSDSVISVPKISEVGRLVFSMSRTIPYTQVPPERATVAGWVPIRIQYNCKKKSYDVPVEKLPELEQFLVELFRASLVKEVAAVHHVHPEDNYSWMVRSFLDRRQIVTSDEQDKDMEWDTAKKIYRDHLSRIQQKNWTNRQLSRPVLSRL